MLHTAIGVLLQASRERRAFIPPIHGMAEWLSVVAYSFRFYENKLQRATSSRHICIDSSGMFVPRRFDVEVAFCILRVTQGAMLLLNSRAVYVTHGKNDRYTNYPCVPKKSRGANPVIVAEESL